MNQALPTLAIATLLAAPLAAQVTQRVAVSSSGAEANAGSYYPRITPDGRYVAFTSDATNLVAGDTNGVLDAFVRDRVAGTTERINVAGDGSEANDVGHLPEAPPISDDGRFVAFSSAASNLVAGDANGVLDVFVRDRVAGTTERVSLDAIGAEGDDRSQAPSMSADGRYVAFQSLATNLVAGDTNGSWDIFVRDRLTGTIERVSVDSAGFEADGDSQVPAISADGRFVVFESDATNLVAGDANASTDVFVHDRQTGTTERCSLDSSGIEGNDRSIAASISADGRFVAFMSRATNLVPADTNSFYDIFVRDRQSGTTERVSVNSSGVESNQGSSDTAISADGRYVAFMSNGTNLVPGDTNVYADCFLRDRQLGTTERVNLTWAGGESPNVTGQPALSADARYVVFNAWALVPGDSNHASDVHVRDRLGGTSFTSLCHPGALGVIACPCGNPPSGSGRGCNNSANTGGAVLSAAGGPFLSCDTLVFTTSGEKPTATSVLLQGTTSPAAGAVYGQGVRCVGGTLKRLFAKSASGGSITVPNFGAFEASVSARSAAKGNPISAGQSRWYLVFYRDPTVLGGCPSSSTFNATQTGLVAWSP